MSESDKSVLVFIEHEEGRVRRGSYEALAFARSLAATNGMRTVAALFGRDVAGLAGEIAARGADVVFAVADERIEPYTPDAVQGPLTLIVRELNPEWVVASHSYQAQDLIPLVAAAFDAPVLSDCVDADLGGDEVVFSRQPYDAKFVARTVDHGPAPRFATLQSGAFSADDLPAQHKGSVTTRSAELDENALRRVVVEVKEMGGGGVDLSAAEIVVAGGRGLQSQENFEKLVSGLAQALGGAVGASRPVVDSDWLPHEHQIGSSGQVIAPRLYVALGISGAIQHVVGIRGAQVTVAINKDKDAPIFNEASYGIVGDLAEIVPEVIKAVLEAKQE